jgi:5-methylcytosine-specific restriction protein A
MARLRQAPARVDRAPARIAYPDKVADPFYRTQDWTRLARDIKRQRGSCCEACGMPHANLIADHVIELKDGGAPLDPLNIQIMCHACHNAKTARERSARRW